MEPHDILADDMHIGRPVPRPLPAFQRFYSRQIIGQRIDPYIHDVLRRPRHRHAPVKRRARDRQVLKTRLYERDDLVAPALGRDEIGMVAIMSKQPVAKCRQAEEVTLLLDPFNRRAGGRTADPVVMQCCFAFIVIGFITNRVPALVAVEIDIAGRFHAAPQRLRGRVMARLGRADERVIRDVERASHLGKARRVAIGERLHRNTLAGSSLEHFLPVLIGPGEEKDIFSLQPHEAGNRIRCQQFIGMADMRRTIGIGDGGGDVEAVRHAQLLALPRAAVKRLSVYSARCNSSR